MSDIKTKNDDQVWVQWFFVANWGELFPVKRENIAQGIQERLSFYGKEFWEKAELSIIDGNQARKVSASEFTPAHRS